MRRFFTKHLLLLIAGVCFISMDAFGQTINTLTITEPEGAAGNYPALRASFGAQEDVEITAEAIIATDANGTEMCGEATNDLTGKMAFLDRGTCGFFDKVKNAEAAGAIAVVVCNNASGDLTLMGAGDNEDDIEIPAFMISLENCQKIRTYIADGGVEATLRNYVPPFECNPITDQYPDDVIWGVGDDENGNRGDFDGGLNGWTFDKDNTWEWIDRGEISKGTYIGTTRTMVGWSGCNGIVVMNSDYLDNEGICPAVCTASLISPNINLPEGVEGVIIEFNQAVRQFQSNYYIQTSKDNGSTWSDPIRINAEIPTNSAHLQGRLAVPVTGFAGADQIRFKFVYEGNYYYWGIDDVILRNGVLADAQVNQNFFAVAPSLRTPMTQVSPMHFLADVSSIGNGDVEGASLVVGIQDESEQLVGLFQEDLGDIAAGESIENILFSETFTPAAQPQFYDAAYVLLSDNDGNDANDSNSFYFEVTENTFGNLLPEYLVGQYMIDIAAIWAVSDRITNYQSFGNIYYLPNGAGWTVDQVRFGLENPFDEVDGTGFVRVELYEWNDEDNDGSCNTNERTLVGVNSIFLDSGTYPNFRNIELPLYGPDADGNADEESEVVLKDNTSYVLIAHSQPLDPSIERYRFLTYNGFDLDSPDDRSIYSSATNYAFELAGEQRTAGSLFEISGNDPDDIDERVFDILGNDGTLFSYAMMYLEMDLKKPSSTYDIARGEAKVFPNPAANELYIDVTLDKVSDVKVELVSIDGRVLTSTSFSGVQDSRLKIDLAGVASGSYTAMIHTNDGVIAKKVIVQK